MAVRELGAKVRLRVLHFGEKLFATVSAAKHGHDALNMCNEIRKIARREDEVVEEGQRRGDAVWQNVLYFWLGFRGLDCSVTVEQGGGPDARPSRAGGCPPLV